jgi:uncharacterized protein (TIGR02246 family)
MNPLTESMIARTPRQKPMLFAQALNAGNLDAMLSFYADDAVFVAPDGSEACGKAEIREAPERFLLM